MLCGLRAHMLDIHTSTCAWVYIYTDIHEGDYYRYRFTYIANTSNYCGILKTAESAPDIRKCLSLSLPSEPVPLDGLANATCQSPSWGGCWGQAGLPISHTCTLHTASGRSKASPPWPHTNPTAQQGSKEIHLPKHSLHPWTSWMNSCIANGEKRPLRGRINLVLRWLPEKGQMNFAWTCLFSPR